MPKTIKIKSTNVGARLDKFLAQKLSLSRSQIQKLIKNGAVLINNQKTTPHYFLKEEESITINQTPDTRYQIPDTKKPNNQLPSFTLDIIAKTPDYLMINKPAGIPVHPDERYKTGTLIQKITGRFPAIKKIGEDKTRPGIIHRLDKDVSGLLVIARTQKMFNYLKEQFQNRQIKKEYLALVHGRITPTSGEINFPITRGKNGAMVARPKNQEGKVAITEYEVLQSFINYSLVKVMIKTGRSHQIRVHFKALGHPIVGDTLHKIKKQKSEKVPLDRLWLHAQSLGFYDLKNNWQEFTIEPPLELKNYLTSIK